MSVFRLLIAFPLAVILSALPVRADAIGDMRSVITGQMTAFLKEDDEAAFSFASPAIRQLYRDPRIFTDMVKRTYAPVYRPGSYVFGEGKVDPDDRHGFQLVLISDRNGQQWAALYEMERQPDGKFAINGVRMLRDRVSNGI